MSKESAEPGAMPMTATPMPVTMAPDTAIFTKDELRRVTETCETAKDIQNTWLDRARRHI